MSNIVIIPARLKSTRLPQKLLLNETGKTVLQHTYEQVIKSDFVDEVIIAVDCDRLYYEAINFCSPDVKNGDVELTGPAAGGDVCDCGTDRIVQVVKKRNFSPDDIIVNVQADEPEINPRHIDKLFDYVLVRDCISADANMTTLATRITNPHDSSVVKVVFDRYHQALYFSRWPIPFGGDCFYRHIGIYAYKVDFLLKFVSLSNTYLEVSEKLEQLRVLENGYQIKVLLVEESQVGIDVRADYDAFVARWKDRLTSRIDP